MFDTSNMRRHRLTIWRRIVSGARLSAALCTQCGERECPANVGGGVDNWVSISQMVNKN